MSAVRAARRRRGAQAAVPAPEPPRDGPPCARCRAPTRAATAEVRLRRCPGCGAAVPGVAVYLAAPQGPGDPDGGTVLPHPVTGAPAVYADALDRWPAGRPLLREAGARVELQAAGGRAVPVPACPACGRTFSPLCFALTGERVADRRAAGWCRACGQYTVLPRQDTVLPGRLGRW